MAYSEWLADRIRQILSRKQVPFEEKKMMGGLAFMINNKMCVGIIKEDLMTRIGKLYYQEALSQPHARPMDFTGKPMKGYVFIGPEGIDMDEHLTFWIDKALDFNKTLT